MRSSSRGPAGRRRSPSRVAPPAGLYYDRSFLSAEARGELLYWLSQIYPIWEERYSKSNPPPEGKQQRRLLRPVYWLGNWQFACLDYYHPPKGTQNRCVRAEPFPPVLARMVERIERIARDLYHGPDMPQKWRLNTCLVNLYGSQLGEGGKEIDCARVGEHKDFEPGPVASVSLGARALFQFVKSSSPGTRDAVVFQQWLDDGSLQIFGGDRWKNRLFHRVQRVEAKETPRFKLNVEGFETRRINLTFRYVPEEHVVALAKLPVAAREDVLGYVEQLARHSPYFARELLTCR